MKKRIAAVFLVVAAGVACGQKGSAPSPGPSPAGPAAATASKPIPDPLPGVVAEVNGRPVAGARLKALADAQIRGGNIPREQQSQVYFQVLQTLIARELLFQEALARKVKIDDKALQRALDRSRARFASEADWRADLARQEFTAETYRADLRAQETVRVFLDAEAAKIGERELSDAETRAYYDSHPDEFDLPERLLARHILVAVASQADAATREKLRAKADSLLARIRKGEDFAKLAEANSDDPGSAKLGGRLPPFGRGQMVKPFEDAAFALKPDELSGLVASPFGYHIIRLYKRLPAEHLTYDGVHARLRDYLLRRKRQQAVEQLVEQLRAKAKIDIKI